MSFFEKRSAQKKVIACSDALARAEVAVQRLGQIKVDGKKLEDSTNQQFEYEQDVSDVRAAIAGSRKCLANEYSEADFRADRRKAKYWAWARWLFSFSLFVYLLALAMTAFEIDAFHTLVGGLTRSGNEVGTSAGKVKQREVLQATRRALAPQHGWVAASPAPPRDQTSLEGMVVHLGDLHAAVNLLAEMEEDLKFHPRSDEAFRQARIDGFRNLVDRIGDALNGLGEDIAAQRPAQGNAIKGEGTREKLKLLSDRLRSLNTEIAKLDALTAKASEGSPDELRKEGGILAQDLDTRVRKLNEALRILESDDGTSRQALKEAVRELQNLNKDRISGFLETAQQRADPATTNKLVQLTERDPDQGRLLLALYAYGKTKNARVGRFPTKPPGTKTPAADVQNLETYLTNFQTDEQIGADGLWGPATREKINEFVKKCNSSECLRGEVDELDSVAIDEQIRTLRDGLSMLRIEIPVAEVDDATKKHLKKVAALGAALARAEVAVQRLGQLNVDAKEIKAASDPANKQREYEQAVVDLRTAIAGLRESLGNEDGLLEIANAIGRDDPQRHRKAQVIASEFDALDRYQRILTPLAYLVIEPPECSETREAGCEVRRVGAAIWNQIANIGFHAKDMATMTRQALDMMVVFVMGAIGSLIYLIKYLLKQTLNLNSQMNGAPVWRPFSWFVFRPLFGIVVAFAIYLLYKTGQVALGGATGNVLASEINLPMLSIFSLFAGLLSWQALEMVESKGRAWLSAQRRENLYAGGLEQALRNAGRGLSDCAAQVGVTTIQVDRWIAGRDKVTPEMQDRITTWLNRDRVEIFGERHPREMQGSNMAWATGLKAALKENKKGIDLPRLASLTEEDVETVHAWATLKRQVDPEKQFLVTDVLGMEWGLLFSYERPDADFWATGLRAALRARGAVLRDAATLAAAVGSTTRNVRAYMELKESVPKTLHDRIAKALGLEDDRNLITPNPPLGSAFKWATKLRECLRNSSVNDVAELAEKIDTEAIWVRAWMELEVADGEEGPPFCGQVAPATQKALAETLGCSQEELFRAERAASDFRWVRMPVFEDRVKERGGVSELASRLDLDMARVTRWLAGAEPVALETQLALLADFGLSVEERDTLFTSSPPPDPSRQKGAWWAIGLRKAVAAHPGLRTLGHLADELDVPAQELYDQAELVAPVSQQRRDSISRILGPIATGGAPLFGTQVPDWSKFRALPGLRSAMARCKVQAEALAKAMDVELARLRGWMEADDADVQSQWVKGKVKRGQVSPASRDALVDVINLLRDEGQHAVNGAELERETTDAAGVLLYARKPALRTAIEAQDGGIKGFSKRIDAELSQVEKWVEQLEPVQPQTRGAILNELGLAEKDRDQLFRTNKGVDEALG